MKRKKGWLAVLGFGLMLSFLFSFLAVKNITIKNGNYATPLMVSENREKKEQDQQVVITENTEILTKVIYEESGQTEVGKIKPTADMVGLTKDDLARLYNGWIIERFTPDQVQITLKVKRQLGVKKEQYYLGIKDGQVVVFDRLPNQKMKLKTVTKISVERLPEQEVKDLERGIAVEGEQELLEILEGLSSYGEY